MPLDWRPLAPIGHRDAGASNTGRVPRASIRPTSFGLPVDFVAQGQQLAAELRDGNQDAADAFMLRRFHAERLDDILEDIVAELERLSAARDLAMALTGEDLPGLELTIARGAAAPRSEPVAEVVTEPSTGL